MSSAMGDGLIDRALSDVLLDAEIIVVAGFLRKGPRCFFMWLAVCQARVITFALPQESIHSEHG